MGERHVIPFGELGLEHVDVVGGKSAHLGDLLQAGFPVPPGFAVTTHAFELVLHDEFRRQVDELVADLHSEDLAELEVKAAHIREVVEKLDVPGELADEIEAGYAALGRAVGQDKPAVAVRSSAVAEDAAGASFAGVQSTYLWLRGFDAVLGGIRRCWASYFNAEALSYRAQHASSPAGMSVAVQYMVDARLAGVMFTLNPVSGDPSSVAIDASYGLGVTVVGGEVTPDSFLVSKVTGEVIRSVLGEKAVECVSAEDGTAVRDVDDERRARLCLGPGEIERLVAVARQVERHYGCHQDLEWAIDRRLGEVFLLQSRAETVWSQKAKTQAPVAGSAIAAIAATFLGGAAPKR
jgi:pyruvate,water dikinase